MKSWIISYKDDRENDGNTIIKAKSNTKALVEFMVRHPNYIYTSVEEMENNESDS